MVSEHSRLDPLGLKRKNRIRSSSRFPHSRKDPQKKIKVKRKKLTVDASGSSEKCAATMAALFLSIRRAAVLLLLVLS
jgi:hypothetical protein